jgi:indole-3-glycerol phosphate synthase
MSELERGPSGEAEAAAADNPGVADILLRIVERRRKRLAPFGRTPLEPVSGPQPVLSAPENPFLAALARHRGRALIAEVKLGSPSLGPLRGRFDPLAVARSYARAGAAALSVVVEPDFFYGSYELLRGCRQASGLPAIAKEFIVDPLQLQWASDAGADAILLVAALYSRDELHAYAAAARKLGLVPLVEIHDLGELGKLSGQRWELVGVNNRNLRTFEVAIEHGLALASTLPTEAIRIAESGITSPSSLHLLRSVGYDAFLVGEHLLLADDPEQAVRELLA